MKTREDRQASPAIFAALRCELSMGLFVMPCTPAASRVSDVVLVLLNARVGAMV